MASRENSSEDCGTHFEESTSTSPSKTSSIMEGSIFDHFENEFGIVIPEFLKNLLKFAGYENALILQDLDSNSLTIIENIAKSIVPKLFQSSLEEYLGPFHISPNDFFIMPGYKTLLEKLSNYAKKYLEKKILDKTPEKTITDSVTDSKTENAEKKLF